jgi:hypothetical protein
MDEKKLLKQLVGIRKALEAPQVHKEEGEIRVTRTRLRAGKVSEESEKSEKISVRTFASYPAHLSVNFARTVNTGNYNSIKIGIMAVVPCYPEEMQEVLEDLTEWVNDRMERNVAHLAGGGDIEDDEDDFPQ